MQKKTVIDERVGADHVFSALDGLRGVAAIVVVLYHTAQGLGLSVFPSAYLAVDFFFALSGFVIAHAYDKRLLSNMSAAEFMGRRIIRLYPLYWAGITASFILMYLSLDQTHNISKMTPFAYLFGIFFFPTPLGISPFSWTLFPFNAPSWSLSLEVWVNLIYAIFVKRIKNYIHILTILVSFILIILVGMHDGTTNAGQDGRDYWGGWARVLWSFSVGVFIRRYLFDRTKNLKSSNSAFLFLFLIMVLIFSCPHTGKTMGYLSVLILCPAIVWVGAHLSLNKKSARIAAWMGAISYPLYITHTPVVRAIELLYQRLQWSAALAPWVSLTGWTLICIGAAWTLNSLYDLPIRAVINRFFSRRRFA